MSDLEKTAAARALRAEILRTWKERLDLEVDHKLPDTLQDHLDALDRAMAERPSPDLAF